MKRTATVALIFAALCTTFAYFSIMAMIGPANSEWQFFNHIGEEVLKNCRSLFGNQ